MDNKTIILISLALLASGCLKGSTPSSPGQGPTLEKFTASDNKLKPEQVTQVEAVFTNGKETDTTLNSEDIQLFNTGEIEVIDKTCNPDSLKTAREDFSTEMRCVWEVKAPGEDWVEGFGSKPLSINMVFEYTTQVEAKEPLSIRFEENNDIRNREKVSKTYSDGKISISITSDSPLPVNKDQEIEISASNNGPGEIRGPYNFEYTPKSIIKEGSCPSEKEPIEGEGTTLECTVNTGLTGERKLFVTTSYKYQQIHNSVIEVVE